MPKLILHKNGITPEELDEIRLQRNLELTPVERMKKAFDLMLLASMFKKGPIKEPAGLGVVLRKK